jgi:hypothetical protein
MPEGTLRHFFWLRACSSKIVLSGCDLETFEQWDFGKIQNEGTDDVSVNILLTTNVGEGTCLDHF